MAGFRSAYAEDDGTLPKEGRFDFGGDWVLRSLWQPSASSRCSINLLDSVLVKDKGLTSWLFTSKNGEVRKKRNIERESLRQRFESLGTRDECCMVRNAGGSHTVVDAFELKRMMNHPNELSGVVAIQPAVQSRGGGGSVYVHERVVADGQFRIINTTFKRVAWTMKPGMRGLGGTEPPPGQPSKVRCTNLHLCRKLDVMSNNVARYLENQHKCKVVKLQSEFIVDDTDTIWLRWVPSVTVARGETARTSGLAPGDPAVTYSSTTSKAKRKRARRLRPGTSKRVLAEDELQSIASSVEVGNVMLRGDAAKARGKSRIKFTAMLKDGAGGGSEDRDLFLSQRELLAGETKQELKYPTPFSCAGDFCDFFVEEPNLLSAEMDDKKKSANEGPPTGSSALQSALRLLSKEEVKAVKASGHFDDLFKDLDDEELAKRHGGAKKSPSAATAAAQAALGGPESEWFHVTRRTIVRAREEQRGRISSGGSGGSGSGGSKKARPTTTGPIGMVEDELPQYMRSTATRNTKTSWARARHSAVPESVQGGVANYYQQVKCCRSCYKIYTILDRIRNITNGFVDDGGAQGLATALLPGRSGGARPVTHSGVGAMATTALAQTAPVGSGAAAAAARGVATAAGRKPGRGGGLSATTSTSTSTGGRRGGRRSGGASPTSSSSSTTSAGATKRDLNSFGGLDDYLRGAPKGPLKGNAARKARREERRKRRASSEASTMQDGDGPETDASMAVDLTGGSTMMLASQNRYVGKVLLADHDGATREEAEVILSQQQYEVDIAEDGHAAMRMIHRKAYDVVLCARELPALNGVELVRLLRQKERHDKTPRLPVIAFTSELGQADLRLYMDVGMDGCVSKPPDKNALLSTMAAAVPKHDPAPPPTPRTLRDTRAGTIGGRPTKPDLSGIQSSRHALPPKPRLGQEPADAAGSQRRAGSAVGASRGKGGGGGSPKKAAVAGNRGVRSGVFQMDSETSIPYAVLCNSRNFGVADDAALFNFVVCQDFFDNYETMQIFFKPLCRKFPGLKILVFNFPGQAYTEWRKTQLLNNKYYAECVQALLEYVDVDGTNEFPTTNTPFYMMGFGNGGNTALYHSIHMHHPAMRCLLLLNSFAYVGSHLAGILHDCINVFSCCPPSRPDLPVYFYTRFIFSGAYLKQVSTPLALNLYTAVHNPITLAGRIQICNGALAHEDLRGTLSTMASPLLIVQSRDGGLIQPLHVEPFVKARGGEVRSIHKCLKRRKRACVVWVQAGHELFQEARKPLANLVEQLAAGYYETHDVPVQHMDTVLGPSKADIEMIKAGIGTRRSLTQSAASLTDTIAGFDGGMNKAKKTALSAFGTMGSVSSSRPFAGGAPGPGKARFEDSFIDHILGAVDSVSAKVRQEDSDARYAAIERQQELERQQEHAERLSKSLRERSSKPASGVEQLTELGDIGVGGRRRRRQRQREPTADELNALVTKTTLDATHPSFERGTSSVYKSGGGSRIYPSAQAMPEVKEYMQWRVNRNMKRLQYLEAAASCVQRGWRAFMAKTLVSRMRRQRATLFLQRKWRGVLGRRRAHIRRVEEWAVALLQRNYRGAKGRLDFNRRLEMDRAARFLQRAYRGRLGNLTVVAIRYSRNQGALRIQTLYRGSKGRRAAWQKREQRNAAITLQRSYRGYLGRLRGQAERDKYLFAKSQSVGIDFGRQMLTEHKLHATRLQSEVSLLLQKKEKVEKVVQQLLYEVAECEAAVGALEKEMHSLSKVETEAEGRLTEKQRIEIREHKMRLDNEFGEMLTKIASRKDHLKTHEGELQQIDRIKQQKENDLHDLERKLVVLLEEQQRELALIKRKQNDLGEKMLDGDHAIVPLSSAEKGAALAGGGGGGMVKYQGPTPQQKQQAANLMQSTETLMKFGFMSMSLTYFSTLNMVKAMRAVGAVDTILAASAASTGAGTPSVAHFKKPLKKGELPGGKLADLEVATWSVEDVGEWLATLSLQQYQDCFDDAAIDGSFLYDLNDDDLRNTLGIEHKLHRKKIINSIRRLKKAEKAAQSERARKQAILVQKAGIPTIAGIGSGAVNLSRPAGGGGGGGGGGGAMVPMMAAGGGGNALPDDYLSDDEEDDRKERQETMNLNLEQLFSWVRHKKHKKIAEAFDAFEDTTFELNRALYIKTQYLEDFGTQYTDDYNQKRHVNMVDKFGNTMLLMASQNGSLKIAKFLIQKGANPNHQNNQGQTALHYAMAYGFYDMGSWLADGENGAMANDGLLNMYGLGVYDGIQPEG